MYFFVRFFRYYRFTMSAYTQWKCSYSLFYQYRKIWAYHSGISVFSSNGWVFRNTRYSLERWQRRLRISNNQYTMGLQIGWSKIFLIIFFFAKIFGMPIWLFFIVLQHILKNHKKQSKNKWKVSALYPPSQFCSPIVYCKYLINKIPFA